MVLQELPTAFDTLGKRDLPLELRAIWLYSATVLRLLIGDTGVGLLQPIFEGIIVKTRERKVHDTERLVPIVESRLDRVHAKHAQSHRLTSNGLSSCLGHR